MDLLDNNSRNFLNDVLTNQDRCSTLECPDNYIQEINKQIKKKKKKTGTTELECQVR